VEETTVEGQGDQSGASNSEALSDSGSGVTGGVQSVGSVTHLFSHFGHLGDTSGVV
jgi:hypothetical protein